ncbi:G-type lectin S-receptor-like serine/threonine-protein kinase [Acorus calamus]|uniref:non-specific serine/threonine protein kinase n=1 Tax=Acorus calamus TaxID=4465 RepID=A0AAV9C2M6_ACOCL|nr:G-type lectin S-receptor-like serine/threonine-protein kinase [Acorus calamus]
MARWVFEERERKHRKRRKEEGEVGTLELSENSLSTFKYRDLEHVTKNFSERLGKGGFGSVYKGAFPDSTVVAVKKLEGSSQGEKQFRTEILAMGLKQHMNLVRLRGFCCQGSTRLLVYDYMPNGSLETHLFKNPSNRLDWKTRCITVNGIFEIKPNLCNKKTPLPSVETFHATIRFAVN